MSSVNFQKTLNTLLCNEGERLMHGGQAWVDFDGK